MRLPRHRNPSSPGCRHCSACDRKMLSMSALHRIPDSRNAPGNVFSRLPCFPNAPGNIFPRLQGSRNGPGKIILGWFDFDNITQAKSSGIAGDYFGKGVLESVLLIGFVSLAIRLRKELQGMQIQQSLRPSIAGTYSFPKNSPTSLPSDFQQLRWLRSQRQYARVV